MEGAAYGSGSYERIEEDVLFWHWVNLKPQPGNFQVRAENIPRGRDSFSPHKSSVSEHAQWQRPGAGSVKGNAAFINVITVIPHVLFLLLVSQKKTSADKRGPRALSTAFLSPAHTPNQLHGELRCYGKYGTDLKNHKSLKSNLGLHQTMDFGWFETPNFA